MNLHIRPILFVLFKNTTGTVLVTLQVAIALAVLCNAVWVIHQRMERINRPTGLDDQNIFAISTASFTPRFNYEASLREDLAYLRGLPGVIAAAPSDDSHNVRNMGMKSSLSAARPVEAANVLHSILSAEKRVALSRNTGFGR